MKYNYSILLIIAILLMVSCKKNQAEKNIPVCIEKIINEQNSFDKPRSIWRWEVDGKTYYYLLAQCCDQFNVLLDESCQNICAPDGGITGQGSGDCPTFKGTIKKTLIWEQKE